MQLAKNIGYYLGVIAASALFLIVEHLTHVEFFLHLAAIPLEVLVAVYIVEKMLERRETKERRRQLMFMSALGLTPRRSRVLPPSAARTRMRGKTPAGGRSF